MDEFVSWDDVVVSGCGLGVGGLASSHPMLGAIPGFWAVPFAGLVLLVAPRAVFFPVVVFRPRCSASRPVWTRRTFMQ